jgi:hypothetical protein
MFRSSLFSVAPACFRAACFLTACFLSAPATAQDKQAHLFILSGQSNMQGMKPQNGFEQEAKKLFGEAPYIKVAQGGRPIRLWVTEWDSIAKKRGIDVDATRAKDKNKGTEYYEPILKQFKAMLKEHPQHASVTFCWMQGERDARENLHEAYGESLTQLISNLRRDLNQPNMYFVIGRLSDFGKSDDPAWQAVRKAQVTVASQDPRGAWVDCDDLNNKVDKNGKARDDLHYTQEGYKLLGERYARQAKLMIDGGKPADNGRPE